MKLKLTIHRGKWCADGIDSNGTRIRKSLGIDATSPPQLAERAFANLKNQILLNGGNTNNLTTLKTFSDAVRCYLDQDRTEQQIGKVKNVENYWGSIAITDINDITVLRWEKVLRDKNLSAPSIKRYFGILQSVLNYCAKRHLVNSPKLTPIGHENTGSRKHHVLDNALRDSILENLAPDAKHYFIVLAYTGCRPIEVSRLTWEDIDMTQRTLTFKSYKSSRGGLRKRTVGMPEQVFEVINTIKQLTYFNDSDYVFRRLDGTPWATYKRPDAVFFNQFKKAAEMTGVKAGLKTGIHPYSLRHTFATKVGRSGKISPMDLAHTLGHSNVQTTMKNYFQGSVDLADDMAKLL